MVAKGSTGVMLTPAEHAERRRAAQHRRRTRRGPSSTGTGVTIFDGVRADREEARQTAREAEQVKQLKFRIVQAELARTLIDPELKDLSLKAATLVIDLFPAVELTQGLGRTRTAELEMRNRLDAEELRRTKALLRGITAARVALSKAFEQHPDKKR